MNFKNKVSIALSFITFTISIHSNADYFSVNDSAKLLVWTNHQGDLQTPDENYNRSKHFGPWVKQPKYHNCLNTRGVILLKNSSAETQISDSGCFIVSGEWHDPYTDQSYTDAKQMDIDHVVPLKNAYQSGAWRWTKRNRCLYANNLANSFHLLPVDSSENRLKSDKSPADYMPPNDSYACEYIKNWLMIKFIWSLDMNQHEADGIKQEVLNHKCKEEDFKLDQKEIDAQKKFLTEHPEICN